MKAANSESLSLSAARRQSAIELKLHNLDQLFNTMDPSPFHEKDLDHDAEEFIVSWAKELPLAEPVRLVVHLLNLDPHRDVRAIIQQAVHNYFQYKADLNQRELRQLLRVGRLSLLIGLCFLALCVSAAELLVGLDAPGTTVLRESLTIGGWVAMWHPMEVFLYGWWPLRRTGRVLHKLSHVAVEVRQVERTS
jgi:hypothetical protein